MAKVIAMFDDGAKADKARDALETSGHGDKVHIVTQSGERPKGTEPIGASGSQAGGAVVGQASESGVGPVMGYAALTDLNLGSEEEEFYRSNLDEGAQLMSVETDNPAEVEALLDKNGASRVDTL